MSQKFTIEFTETSLNHLGSYAKSERNVLLDAIKAQLPNQATEETRNRKLLRTNPLADWELRVRKYRVFYDVDGERGAVRIIAIGHKEHNRLIIGGEEVEL
jgi:mRNA-degrading endonuclease RelE of RelBE toxin-antitoxin system